MIILTGKLSSQVIQKLDKTCHNEYVNYHLDTSLININLNKDEIIKTSEIEMNI